MECCKLQNLIRRGFNIIVIQYGRYIDDVRHL